MKINDLLKNGLCYEDDEDETSSDVDDQNCLIIQSQMNFILAETARASVTYRCENCRNCKSCKEHENKEIMSIREEIKQDIINKPVKVNINE